MTSFNLQWSETKLSQLNSEKYAHFFLLSSKGTVLYIGNVHHENLGTTIQTAIQDNNLGQLDIHIHLGRIREYGTRSISLVAMNSIQNLLVFACKPRLNREGKLNYRGLANLRLANTGFDLLPAVRAENQIVFLRKKRKTAPLPYATLQAG